MAFEIGVTLPSAGPYASRDAVARVAEAAEELGFHSVWVPEHLIVAAEAGEGYGRVLDPFACLAFVAGRTERVELGTSILLLPLHHPVHVAKQAATLQELSGGRFLLGIGVGWHEPEFRYLGVPFEGRGRRTEEALGLIRRLWAGEVEDAIFEPRPDRPPAIWIGGNSDRALRRAREHGDVWHPNAADPARVRRGKEAWPEGRIVPRVGPELLEGDPAANVAAFREEGADGLVIRFGSDPDEMLANMRRFGRDVLGSGRAGGVGPA